jgi:hypothetical protein
MYWNQNIIACTHKKALLDILLPFVDLDIRVLRFVSDAQNMPE